MEELIQIVSQKVGISPEQARQAVDTVTNYLKDKVPGGLGGSLDQILSGSGGGLGDITKNLGGLFGKK